MKRLTRSNPSGSSSFVMGGEPILTIMPKYTDMQVALDRLAAYEGTGLEPEQIERAMEDCADTVAENQFAICEINEMGGIDHLRELIQAEKDGRLMVLPCNVGDTVYEANKRGFVSTYKVISVHISDCSVLVGWELIDGIYSSLNGFEVSALGKTVFLTRAEAEAALKKREERK